MPAVGTSIQQKSLRLKNRQNNVYCNISYLDPSPYQRFHVNFLSLPIHWTKIFFVVLKGNTFLVKLQRYISYNLYNFMNDSIF